MDKAWQRYVDAVAGLTGLTRQNAEKVVRNLVKSGEVAADRAERNVDDLLKRSQRNRSALMDLVTSETERAAAALGFVRREEFDALRARIEVLERMAATRGSQPRARARAPRRRPTPTTATETAASTTATEATSPPPGDLPRQPRRSAAPKKTSTARKTAAARKTATAPKTSAARRTATAKTLDANSPAPVDPAPTAGDSG